ncbi:MAG: bifunctional diaminohydroxyphosphoribosylaminopyrimidine deaminase/5-amino-6-(5-phosphoribosylamino)uracil reductase RibD [Paludibacteraceae bacterium]|nr:bifunctional diaminohydroxyphosphoribosylaminopyrimidine deaminase/5-amino-6-(5-phosphoribosylamino)uracil reductase RibD [Paludibacteraceae bacterium]
MQIKNEFFEQMMARCLQIAQNGAYYVAPNPMVGAVLCDAQGHILSEGWHQQYGGPHAEVNCLRHFEMSNLQSPINNLQDCTLFVSLEPCSHFGKTPPCADLIISKGIGHVVVGMLDPNPLVAGNGVRKLREAGIEATVGVLEEACREFNKRFLCLQEKHRPYITLKWAQTSDGYIDVRRNPVSCTKAEHLNGALAISSPFTKRLVHQMRAENMAILVGSNTALLDDPKLLNTHWSGRHPIRVLLDRRRRVPKTAHIFSDEAETIVYSDNTDWSYVVSDLAQRGIHSVLVEGGAQVLNSILASGIYDEIHVEVSPFILAQEGVPAPKIDLPSQPTLEIDGHRLYEIHR